MTFVCLFCVFIQEPTVTDKNLLEWRFEMNANEEVEVPVEFNVSYPDKRQVRYAWPKE